MENQEKSTEGANGIKKEIDPKGNLEFCERELILTVQSAEKNKDKWRLGLNTDGSKYFTLRESVKIILSPTLKVDCKAACKPIFHFNGKVLSGWITQSVYHKYIPKKPTRLLFKLTVEENEKVLKFICKQPTL